MNEHWWRYTGKVWKWRVFRCLKCRDYTWSKQGKDSTMYNVHDCPRNDVKADR